MSASDLKVSIVIPVWNNPTGIKNLLESFSSAGDTLEEIIVVEKVRNELTSEICGEHGAKYIVHDAGRSAAKNYGYKIATGDWIMFLDSDMALEEGAINICLEGSAEFDALCLRERVVYGSNYWARARAIERNAMFRSDIYESVRVIRRDVLHIIGGYDEQLDGYEDLDLHARIMEGGYRIGWSEATVLHNEDEIGFKAYLSKRRLYALGKKVYATRHPARWKQLRSPSRRLKLIASGMHGYKFSEISYLIPGLALLRGIEFLDSMLFE